MSEQQIPSIGRSVHFRLSAAQAAQINRRRCARPHEPGWPAGAQAHCGNSAHEGDVVPMTITAVWPEEYASADGVHSGPVDADGKVYKPESAYGVNGQALLDGNDSLWVTSAPQHSTLPGCWFWPPRA